VVLLAGVGAASPAVSVDGPTVRVRVDGGGWAEVAVGPDGIAVRVDAGDPIDEVVLRSYCIGAVHMGLGWVLSESLAVDDAGEVHDLTVRSLGVLRAADLPHVDVAIERSSAEPVAVSDAVFAATAAAAWRHLGLPLAWPTATTL
jgi:CO/xanthine dehydrogenase Mo-binding subunit